MNMDNEIKIKTNNCQGFCYLESGGELTYLTQKAKPDADELSNAGEYARLSQQGVTISELWKRRPTLTKYVALLPKNVTD